MIELDLADDFAGVAARAIARHGGERIARVLAATEGPCPRAAALARLWVRRFALGRPAADGPSWRVEELLRQLDAELARMGVAGGGCGRPECHACAARICPDCGGRTCAPSPSA